jgi:acylphosphatase
MTTRTPTDASRRVRALVRGRVQGVGFRYDTVRVARGLGLRGWVRNTAEGHVELVAEGPAEHVERLLAWCRQGPPAARVTGVEHRDEPPTTPLAAFEIRY